jgi:hypothetical protein
MTKVLPEYIAYVAVLVRAPQILFSSPHSHIKCRHVLNVRESWATQDANFYADAFYQMILDLFVDEQWAEETLLWWNR